MTQFHKQVFRKMNLDGDVRTLQPGEYRLLTNGIPINGIISNPNDFNINSIFGNELIEYSLPAGVNTVIGFLEDKAGGRAFIFTHNDTDPADNAIYQYTVGTITLVFKSALLGFASTQFVDADIIGDILIFTNNSSELYKIDVAKAIAGGTYTPTLEEITLIKRPPQLPLSGGSTSNVLYLSNYIYRHHFQFFYQYVYENDDQSVFSSTSGTITVTDSAHNKIIIYISSDEVIPATVKQINFAVIVDGSNELIIYKRDFPVAGVLASLSHDFYNDTFLETVPDSLSVKWNDSVPLRSKSLRVFKNRTFLFNNTEGYEYTNEPLTIVATAEHASMYVATEPYYKEGYRYSFGLMWFDNYGRHAGVHIGTEGSVTIPDDRKWSSAAPYIVSVDLSGISMDDIPLWATHFAVVRTNANLPFFIQITTTGNVAENANAGANTKYYTKDSNGEFVYDSVYSATKSGIALDISLLTTYGLGYTFQKGDRVKVYSVLLGVLNETVDFEIKEQSGRYIYVGLHDFGLMDATPLFLEIYTPPTSSDNLFYEIGSKYVINNSGTGSRSLSVSIIAPYGDSHISVDRPTPFYEAMNTFDLYFDKWIRRTKRAIASYQIGSQELQKINYLRFGQIYNKFGLNGINTFEALDDYALPIENGAGTLLVDDGFVMVAIHEVETGSIYVGEGFVNTTDGAQFLAKTDNVIGDDRTYLGGQGTTVQKSVVVKNGRVYYLDLLKGHIVRRSHDGLTRISDYGIRGYIAEVCRAYRDYIDYYDICAGWDPQYDCYVISFLQTAFAPLKHNQVTLYFHEKTNAWVAASNFQPRFLGTFRDRQLAFVAGATWLQSVHDKYNNWFGVQYDRTLEWEVGQDSLEKIWESIEVDVDSIYDTDDTNEDVVLLYDQNPDWTTGTIQTKINYADFVRRGSAWRSAFFRWISDLNFATETESKYKSSHSVRGQSAYFKITYNGTDRNPMKSITVGYRPSMNTIP